MNSGILSNFDDNPFVAIESRLDQLLNPIAPDQEFIERLQRRLTTTPPISVEAHRKPLWLALILAAGLVFGVFFYWLFGRSEKRSQT